MVVERRSKKDNTLVWKIDKSKKTYEYFFRKESAQGDCIKQLIFKGFSKQPTSLNSNGYGYSSVLKPFFYHLKDTFQTIQKIEVIDGAKTQITKKGRNIYITFNKEDYESLVSTCVEIYRENSTRLKDVCYNDLTILFKRYFPQKTISKYRKNTISKILQNDNILDVLSTDDIKSIAGIIPDIMDKSTLVKQKVLNKMLFFDIKNKVTKIKFTELINDFENMLKKKTQNEAEWQMYIKNNILFLNSSYLNVIDKSNISLRISIPDFLLVDQFQFVDIFEIKKPDFNVVQYDKSHDNYYWSAEASKAISQVEKYIYDIEKHSDSLMNNFREKGIDLQIIRPRGFVLIGKRIDLENQKSKKDFRILNSSLKNVQVIFYDDFLESIKNRFRLLK